MAPTWSFRRLRPVGVVLGAVLLVALVALAGAMASRAEVTGETPAEQIRCIARLADERPWGAARALALAAVEKPDPSVRRAALVALGRLVPSGYRPTVQAALDDNDPVVRSGAAVALGGYGGDSAAERLAKLAGTDESREVRLAAVTGLGRIDRPRSTTLLIRLMQDRGDPVVKTRALNVVCDRLGFRYSSPPQPGNPAAWAEMLAYVREIAKSMNHLDESADEAGESNRP